ncbi:UPF0561 protein C2orf68-like [Aotus nancymaae]|uniref:UPF0561 protein C2orf68-like n=1 Tax=Aotus nancymaae TaxID=37293 RepID=UPI0030FE26DC
MGTGPGHSCRPRGRLDMNHGFVHHIRRNHIARGDCDKKVKQAAKEKVRTRHTPSPTGPREPELRVYLRRPRDVSAHPRSPDDDEWGESSSSGGSELFCMEYEADSGEVTSVMVYRSEELSARKPLDPPMREALQLHIQEEIAMRRSRH